MSRSLVLIQTGMHIGVALMLLSFVGVWAIKGIAVARQAAGELGRDLDRVRRLCASFRCSC